MLLNLYVKLHSRLMEIRDEDGATAAEYGLLVALIAAVIIVAATALGVNIAEKLQEVADAIGAA
jgi:pilus assembly protein Flp/PilA